MANSPDLAGRPEAPTAASARIVSLDVVRGVALLGILLLNIVGMGMLSTAYFHPHGGSDGVMASVLDQRIWMAMELFFEGSMRALFSMLFGAGVILFTQTKSGALHYRRTFWLFLFGLFDAYVLQWSGDILLPYAVAGAILYLARNASIRRLIVLACAVLLFLLLVRVAAVYGLEFARAAHNDVIATEQMGETPDPDQVAVAESWREFRSDRLMSEQAKTKELAVRSTSLRSSFEANMQVMNENLLFVFPIFMLWDALAMMLIGMALYRAGVLQGARSSRFYLWLAVSGFAIGLGVNALELRASIVSGFDVLVAFSYLQITYDLGRLALALGYMAIIIWLIKQGVAEALMRRLAAVGRMALTNYLMHSVIALFIFTGAGLGLVGQFDRATLYVLVICIWMLQLWFSPWWLSRHDQGPVEALWRRLTYS